MPFCTLHNHFKLGLQVDKRVIAPTKDWKGRFTAFIMLSLFVEVAGPYCLQVFLAESETCARLNLLSY